jgi:hypothetical protein
MAWKPVLFLDWARSSRDWRLRALCIYVSRAGDFVRGYGFPYVLPDFIAEGLLKR